jgi:cytochrome c556
MVRNSLLSGAFALLVFLPLSASAASVQEERHDLMESAKGAAKPIGEMLKGERDFDAAVVEESLGTWEHVAATAGDLFPPGSETGYDTEAKSTVWTDRAGFDQALQEFSTAVSLAIEADPQDVEALKTATGPVFKACKGCHDGYRVEH